MMLAAIGMAFATAAHAHHAPSGFTYEPYCCNGDGDSGDCQSISSKTVHLREKGYEVTLLPGDHKLATRRHVFLIPQAETRSRRTTPITSACSPTKTRCVASTRRRWGSKTARTSNRVGEWRLTSRPVVADNICAIRIASLRAACIPTAPSSRAVRRGHQRHGGRASAGDRKVGVRHGRPKRRNSHLDHSLHLQQQQHHDDKKSQQEFRENPNALQKPRFHAVVTVDGIEHEILNPTV